MNHTRLTCRQMLKEIRKNRNISQKTLADELCISRGYLSNIERGDKKPSLWLRTCIRSLHIKYCLFKKPIPLVEVMTPEQPKKSLFQRIMEWFKK